MAHARFCKHGNLRMTCPQCKVEAVEKADERVVENRRRGESGTVGRITGTQTPYPWQHDSLVAWRDGGKSGLVAISLGLPFGDLPYAVIGEVVNDAPTTNVLIACDPGETEHVRAALSERFNLLPSTLADHHFMEPRDDGTLLVADVEELQTVDLAAWGRFATNGLLVLMDADGVGPHLGQLLLEAPFRHRFSLSRKPSAIDLLSSRPWARAFGPLLYRFTEDQAREMGILPRIRYRLHVEMLRPEQERGPGPEGPWEATDIPTRLPGFTPGSFVRGRARDVAIRRAGEVDGLVVIHDGVAVPGAAATLRPSDLPEKHEEPPSGWLLALPTADTRTLMRVATTAWKTLQEPGLVEDAVVLPVPADLCQVPPWDDKWRAAAAQIDRVGTGLLLAEEPQEALQAEDLEVLVGVALALRGLPQEDLYSLTPVVAEAAEAAHAGTGISPARVQQVARAFGGLAAALCVGAASGPLQLLRIAHPRFTPVTPDLPHPSLGDARHHAWRGRAFAALAQATRSDLVTTWGRHPELRFVFPSSGVLEAATKYCADHKLRGPLHDAKLQKIPDRTRIAAGDHQAATDVLQVWRQALGKAEDHEREFLADMHARQPERERRREGMSLPSLAVLDSKGDHMVLESTTGRFPATNIAPGSEISIVEQGERKELARGLVSKISSRRVTIECPAGAPRSLPKRVTVNLTFDAKVFEAYHSAVLGALRAMGATQPDDDGPDGLLRAALLGEEPGEAVPQSINLEDLTPTQKDAIETVLEGGRVRLVHGPPGTGKTHTLVRLGMALTRAGHSVLVTADSNAAVDNMVVGLRRQGALVVRIGHAPNLRDEAAEPARIDPLEAPLFVRWAAEQGIVVATTNYGAFRYLDAKGSVSPFLFDYVIHDEAGQATAPSSLAAVMRGRRLVLAGDPLQLPPTVVSMDAKEAGLDVTLFDRIQELTGKERTRMLQTQFRMREPILAFSNHRYYEDRIESAPSAAAQDGLPEVPALAFQHVTGRENARQRNGSISNDFEVDAVAHMVAKFRNEARDRGWTMAVLTPYQAQRERLRRALPDIEVSTVDGAQGREWDIVLYSSVRSNPKHRLGFVSDERRLNVAVTRARRNFVLVGDERTLRDEPAFGDLLERVEKIRMYYPDRDRSDRGGPQGRQDGNKRRRRRRSGGDDSPGGGDAPPRAGKRRRRGRRPRRQDAEGGQPDDPGGEAQDAGQAKDTPGERSGARAEDAAEAGADGSPDAERKGKRRGRRRRRKRASSGTDAEPGQEAAKESDDAPTGRGRSRTAGPKDGDEAPAPGQKAKPKRPNGEAKGKTEEHAKGKAEKPAKGKAEKPEGKTEEPAKGKAEKPTKGKTEEPAKGKARGKAEAAKKKAKTPAAKGKPPAAKPKPSAAKGPAGAKASKAPGQCTAMTQAGTRCKLKARPGSRVCGRHQ